MRLYGLAVACSSFVAFLGACGSAGSSGTERSTALLGSQEEQGQEQCVTGTTALERCVGLDEAKMIAHKTCETQELSLTDYSLGEKCEAQGTGRVVSYECCPLPAPGEGPGTQPGKPDGGSEPTGCFTEVIGTESSCKPESVWRQYAKEACVAKKSELKEFGTSVPCGDGFSYAKYSCCPTDQVN